MADNMPNLMDEFKNAKPPEKVVIVVGVLAVVGVAFYLYKRGTAASTSTPSASAGSPAGGQMAGYPMAGSNPVVPNGTNPLFDPSGNLIGWQNPPPPGPTPSPKPTPTPLPPVPTNPPTTGPGQGGIHINKTPLISDAMKVWFGKGNQIYFGTSLQNQQHFNIPSGFTPRAGSDGRYWLINGNQQQLLTNNFLYGQSGPGMIASKTVVAKTAGGGQH